MPQPALRDPLFDAADLAVVRAARHLFFANPFADGAEASGARRASVPPRSQPIAGDPREVARRTAGELAGVLERAWGALVEGAVFPEAQLLLYADAWFFHLRERCADGFRALDDDPTGPVPFYADYRRAYDRFLGAPLVLSRLPTPPHLFAVLWQLHRAALQIASSLVGASRPVARVRAQVWHAIFTRDLRRYIRVLYGRMARIPLLVTGPTGTGKEMVARAVAGSSYIPFDERVGRFLCDPRTAYHPHNISEKAETLVESELFGHVKGAFTGATADREGILSRCGAHGTFFLDEVGELVPEIQVKLLRVLQDRTFQRVGDPRPTPFLGKIVAATNRDLLREIEEGTFRRDLYYRLKGNRIATPTLREILEDSPGDRRALVHHIAERLAGPEEADAVTEDVEAFLDAELPGYPWPGNVRELEDCVESILVDGTYTPDHEPATPSQSDPVFDDDVRRGKLDDDQMSRRYATHVRALAGTNREAARWLKINVRTLRERLDHALLARLLERMGQKKGDDGDE